MSEIETSVARQYGREALEAAIMQGLRAMGREPEAVTIDDLAVVDEFHVGGRKATIELLDQLDLAPGAAVLDLGCGVGGPARIMASHYGCRVTGADLTPDFVEVARRLTGLVGLEGKITFLEASILDLPLPDAGFEAATLLHVGMNIPDKRRLCGEVARVLRPGGRFAIYDVMRVAEGPLAFPVPWARDEAASFVETPAVYRQALESASFSIVAERDRREAGVAFFARQREREAASGRPPLSIATLLGEDARPRFANLVRMLEEGLLAPIEMIARRG